MSTRAQILVTEDNAGGVLFYRHSDGYPDGVMPSLAEFLGMVQSGKIRRNAEQSSGWLIIIGHEEYREDRDKYSHTSWKVGAYEPAECIHGDIEYFYVVNVSDCSITVYKPTGKEEAITDFLARTDGKRLDVQAAANN